MSALEDLALSSDHPVVVAWTGEAVQAPTLGSAHAAGFDLRAAHTETIPPNDQRLVSTGIRMMIPCGYEGQIRPRSGLARSGLTIPNSPGTIDADYRGVVGVILRNNTAHPMTVMTGDRIAQLVINKLPRVRMVHTNHLDDTARGSGGFGSTGLN